MACKSEKLVALIVSLQGLKWSSQDRTHESAYPSFATPRPYKHADISKEFVTTSSFSKAFIIAMQEVDGWVGKDQWLENACL